MPKDNPQAEKHQKDLAQKIRNVLDNKSRDVNEFKESVKSQGLSRVKITEGLSDIKNIYEGGRVDLDILRSVKHLVIKSGGVEYYLNEKTQDEEHGASLTFKIRDGTSQVSEKKCEFTEERDINFSEICKKLEIDIRDKVKVLEFMDNRPLQAFQSELFNVLKEVAAGAPQPLPCYELDLDTNELIIQSIICHNKSSAKPYSYNPHISISENIKELAEYSKSVRQDIKEGNEIMEVFINMAKVNNDNLGSETPKMSTVPFKGIVIEEYRLSLGAEKAFGMEVNGEKINEKPSRRLSSVRSRLGSLRGRGWGKSKDKKPENPSKYTKSLRALNTLPNLEDPIEKLKAMMRDDPSLGNNITREAPEVQKMIQEVLIEGLNVVERSNMTASRTASRTASDVVKDGLNSSGNNDQTGNLVEQDKPKNSPK
ncbi:hypothetical protein OAT84_02980 [Gammaproteobacteria bacterium]|nr:hypothetical protein [Gammaproteobacteria bacterium]